MTDYMINMETLTKQTTNTSFFCNHDPPKLTLVVPALRRRLLFLGAPGASPLHAAVAQPGLRRRERVEHPAQQHRQGPVQGGHARAAQRANQHAAAAL